MAARRILVGLLLGFVVFTAGYAIGKEVGVRRGYEAGRATTETAPDGPCTPSPRRQLIAYYFHGKKRCEKCNTIEAYAREALETRFPDRLARNEIVWQAANMDDVWNQDFVERFGLSTSSLVLMDVEDGRELDHTVCRRVWDLTDDKETFFDYVQSEVEMFIDEWPSAEEDG